MKASPKAQQPGTRPELLRSWTTACRRRTPPPKEARSWSTRRTSTRPTSCSAPLKQKAETPAAWRRHRRSGHGLLYKGFTKEAPPPLARRRRRSRPPTGRGRTREYLIPRWCRRRRRLDCAAGQTLDLLIRPPTGGRAAVSTASRSPEGHRRRRRLLSPPAETEAHFSAALNCWGEESREGDKVLSRPIG